MSSHDWQQRLPMHSSGADALTSGAAGAGARGPAAVCSNGACDGARPAQQQHRGYLLPGACTQLLLNEATICTL